MKNLLKVQKCLKCGATVITKEECTCGSDCTLRNNGFSRTGYHFAHWKKDSNTTFTMNENVKTKIGGSIKSDWEQVNLTGIFDINVCKVTYDANGGAFTRRNHIEVNPHIKTDIQTVNYGGYFGGEGTMRDAQGGYYKAIRTGYEINPSEAWKSNNKTYSEEKRYSALEICGTALNTGNVNITLYVNWKPKKYTVKINGDYNIINKIYLGNKTSTKGSISGKYDYGTKITINADKKNYYKFEGWKNSSGKVIYSGLKSTITVTDDLDLTASGRLSKIYVVYHYNGGKLKPGPYQKCTLIAGCKKNECYYKGDDYPKQLSGCTRDECADKTCYKTPGEDNYGHDDSWSKEGFRNYSEKKNATIYLTKKVDNQKYNATGKWHIGSKSGGTISEDHIFNDTYNTGLEVLRLCDKKHKSGKYEETLKNNDVTVHLYAGWKKA